MGARARDPVAMDVAPDGAVKALARAPWPDDLATAARQELTLAPLGQQRPPRVDVAVIGGGVAGLSAAIGARSAGARVLLLEAEMELGHGATGRNAGILSAGINMGLADVPAGSAPAAMWPATTEVLLALVVEAVRPGALLSASLTGALTLAERSGAARHLAREARARAAAGLRAELWTPVQVAEATDGRLDTRSVLAALWLPDEGRIQPLTLLAHLAWQAREVGVILAGDAPVAAYEEVKGHGSSRHWRIQAASGMAVEARGIVLAVGPTVRPTRRIYALAFSADLPDSFPLFWDAAPYTYCDFRPGKGRLVASGGRYGRAGAAQRDAHYHQQLADAARRWLPELRGKAPTHTWAVDLAVSADMVPRAREVGEMAPGVTIEGLGALGILPGIVLGRRAGEDVARRL
jgi:glycine/D-amino acid oxidase-like deaminating enzyme